MPMNMESREAFAKRLVDKFRELGWSQDRLAEESGISPRAVSDFARRTRTPNEETLDAIAKAMKVAPDPNDVRNSWPKEMRVFLDLIGVWLMARPEVEREALMRDLARQIAETA